MIDEPTEGLSPQMVNSVELLLKKIVERGVSILLVEQKLTIAFELANKHYGKDVELNRDPDVLDTWFSSGLWPFATLGWPDKKDFVKKFYPTTVLVTGFDIIFFWVSRMIMAGYQFRDNKPFNSVYFTGIVRA